MQVIPGYQRMRGATRARLLTLGELGELDHTVYVRELAGGSWRVTDHRSTFIIHADGEYDRIAVPHHGGPP